MRLDDITYNISEQNKTNSEKIIDKLKEQISSLEEDVQNLSDEKDELSDEKMEIENEKNDLEYELEDARCELSDANEIKNSYEETYEEICDLLGPDLNEVSPNWRANHDITDLPEAIRDIAERSQEKFDAVCSERDDAEDAAEKFKLQLIEIWDRLPVDKNGKDPHIEMANGNLGNTIIKLLEEAEAKKHSSMSRMTFTSYNEVSFNGMKIIPAEINLTDENKNKRWRDNLADLYVDYDNNSLRKEHFESCSKYIDLGEGGIPTHIYFIKIRKPDGAIKYAMLGARKAGINELLEEYFDGYKTGIVFKPRHNGEMEKYLIEDFGLTKDNDSAEEDEPAKDAEPGILETGMREEANDVGEQLKAIFSEEQVHKIMDAIKDSVMA